MAASVAVVGICMLSVSVLADAVQRRSGSRSNCVASTRQVGQQGTAHTHRRAATTYLYTHRLQAWTIFEVIMSALQITFAKLYLLLFIEDSVTVLVSE